MNRRDFVKGALMAQAGIALASNLEAQPQSAPPTPAAGSGLPKGRLGKLEISRLILGGNLLTHYTHSRDLRYVYTLAEKYNTDEKILDTLAAAEAHGINALCIHNPPKAISLLKRYRKERGGKMKYIICSTTPVEVDLVKYKADVESLVADGADAIYLWGVHADALVNQGRLDLVAKALEVAKKTGVPAGVGGHCLDVVKACEKEKVEADFYIKTFHHHNYPTGPRPDELKAPYNEYPGYWCQNPEETIAVMKEVKRPWIAFKTMAAGAIPPKDAFEYCLKSGADFVLAGMFDFEIAEDVQVMKEALAGVKDRARPWLA